MNDALALEEPPVFVRVYTEANRPSPKFLPSNDEPNDDLVLTFDTETTTDVRQQLRFGIARVYARAGAGEVAGGREPLNLCRTIVLTGKLTDAERRRIAEWSEEHRAEVLPVERFVREVFVPFALDMRAVVVGFNLPFDLSRLAVDWSPKVRVGTVDHFTLRFVPRGHPLDPHTPKLRIRRLDSTKGFVHFVGTKDRERRFRGAFVDLRTFVHVLTGEKHSLESAGETFGCSLKKTKADYGGPINAGYLDYCLADVDLAFDLYERCLERYRAFEIAEHPSRLFSPASLGKAALRARGIVPPQLSAEWIGRVMSAFYAGKVELRVRLREVEDVAVLDFLSQFPSLFCLLGADRILTANDLRPRRSTEEVRTWLESLTAKDLLCRETWADPRMWTLCEVDARGELLPIRSTYHGDRMSPPTIGWNHVTTEPGKTLRYLVPDLIAAKLLSGRVPKIVRATTFEPVGRQAVRPIRLFGVDIGADEDTVRRLSEERIREKASKKPGWKSRAQGLKILSNALAYGITVEVNRTRRAAVVTVHGATDRPFEWEDTEVEEPGDFYCPLLGATLTSGSHLLLALAEAVVQQRGGEVVYEDTDSVFVTPSRIAPAVTAAFDALNPYSVPTHFLKDETEEKAPKEEYPVGCPTSWPSFFGISCKRYALFARDHHGRPHVFRKAASDHGLGSFEVGGDRKDFIAKVWEAIIEDPDRAGERFAGIPATAQFALSTPQLLPRVKALGPVPPFSFMTARYLEPSAMQDGWRSELVPFVGRENNAARDSLMELPGQRDWSSVLSAFKEHSDRKCGFNADGRMARREVLVRANRVDGIGKEANRIETARVLGVGLTGARAKVYTPWIERILALPLEWGPKHGIPRSSFARLRRALRGGRIPTGHGGVTLRNVRVALQEVGQGNR